MSTLLVASTGGHLAELHALTDRLGVGPDRTWVTFDTPQSRSLLAGEDVVHVPPATSRDLLGTTRDLLAARRLLRGGRYTRVISTGASVAWSVFAPATRAGLPCHYIESATRTEGASLTGRLVARLPRTSLYTQHAGWADQKWRHGGSVFDGYRAVRRREPREVRSVVVALGTHPRYRFARLLDRLVRIMPAGVEVLWQVGATRIADMPAGAREQVPFTEMRDAMQQADVVVTHAGVGSALAALAAGHRAIYVPRRSCHGEHIDDHQVRLAADLNARGLVLAREADTVTADDLRVAAGWTVEADPAPPVFPLAGRHLTGATHGAR
jgi:UDP-N-acetylglucosamine transferase subunit ALG13